MDTCAHIYNHDVMKNSAVALIVTLILALSCLTAFSKPAGPTASSRATSSPKSPDAVQLKLQSYSGPAATVIATSQGEVNPKRMLLDLGHQQDLALLLLGDLKGVGTSDALALRMHGKGQGESVFC